MDLREYEQSKFSIAHILRSALACVPQPTTDLHERLQPLFARLAEDRFNLVVVGRFNRGKTSLMNAILGTDRLPTGIIPLTSVITSVGYGSSECVVLRYRDSMLAKEIAIDELPQHVTQLGNPGNVQRIATAEIRLPAEILRRGFYFVDTPGLGSVIGENTLTTEAFLPEADAFVLVTSYESPLSEEEVSFFKTASASGRRIFVVINKHDTVSPEQRETVLRFVRDQLNDRSRVAPPFFSVSSTDGLTAKLSGDGRRLGASGLPALEEELIGFLLREKSKEFLQRMCDRARKFLQELPRSKEIATLTLQIDALAGQFRTEVRTTLTGPLSAVTSAFPALHRLETCEICAKIADQLWDFLCKYQYAISADSTDQQRLGESGGLCPFHAWQLQSVASAYGMCAGYPALLDRLAAKLRHLASKTPLAEEIRTEVQTLVPSERECALCIARNRAEKSAVEETVQRLEESQASAMKELSAICLPHFIALVSALSDDRIIRTLLERHAAVLERFSEDMSRYAIKHDGRRRYLASKEEESVAERGLLLIAGRRQVNFLPRVLQAPSLSDANSTDQKSSNQGG
jgi:GTP-binding protein EngB required for normal cell division